jgi:hypothetical protein
MRRHPPTSPSVSRVQGRWVVGVDLRMAALGLPQAQGSGDRRSDADWSIQPPLPHSIHAQKASATTLGSSALVPINNSVLISSHTQVELVAKPPPYYCFHSPPSQAFTSQCFISARKQPDLLQRILHRPRPSPPNIQLYLSLLAPHISLLLCRLPRVG